MSRHVCVCWCGCPRSRRKMVNKHREQGFDLSIANDKLPDYNALFDRNLRHYFENRNVQHHLYRTGMVRALAWLWVVGCWPWSAVPACR